MPPSSSLADVNDRRLGNSESSGGGSRGMPLTPIRVKLPNDIIGKLGAGVVLSLKRIRRKFTVRIKLLHGLGIRAITSLGKHIAEVVQLSAKKQVLRSYAPRIVAFVQNVFSVRYFSKMKKPRSPIGFYGLHAPSSRANSPVSESSGVDAACPQPTLAKFGTMLRYRSILIDFGPKAFRKSGGISLRQRGMLYKRYHDQFSCPSALLAQRAFNYTKRPNMSPANHMKTTLKFSFLIVACLGIISCSSFRNGAPPTKTESALFQVTTNYTPTLVTVTNPPAAPGQPPTVSIVTSNIPTYSYAPGSGVQAAQNAVSVIPGYGSLAGMGIGALAAVWAWIRSTKSGATAATLAQSIETIREFVKALPNGANYDSELTTWLQQHQNETGTAANVLTILANDVSNPDAKAAAQQVIAAINALNPTALPPGTAVKV